MGALAGLLLRALAWAGAGYVANDVVDAVKECEHVPITDGIKQRAGRYITPGFWINVGIIAGVGTAVLIAKMTKAQRKKVL